MPTNKTSRRVRLPQAALDHADKILDSLPPLTERQRADLGRIIYGSRPTPSAPEERGGTHQDA